MRFLWLTMTLLLCVFTLGCGDNVKLVRDSTVIGGGPDMAEVYDFLLVSPEWSEGRQGDIRIIEVTGAIEKSAVGAERFNGWVRELVAKDSEWRKFLDDGCKLKYGEKLRLTMDDFTAAGHEHTAIADEAKRAEFAAKLRGLLSRLELTAQFVVSDGVVTRGNALVREKGTENFVLIPSDEWYAAVGGMDIPRKPRENK